MARLGNLLTPNKKTEALEPESPELNPPSLTMWPQLHCLTAPIHLQYL